MTGNAEPLEAVARELPDRPLGAYRCEEIRSTDGAQKYVRVPPIVGLPDNQHIWIAFCAGGTP